MDGWEGNTYLASAMGRDNLVIETGALVHKVVLDNVTDGTGTKLQVTGVRYGKSARTVLAQAKQ